MIFHTRNKIFLFNFEPLDSAEKSEANKYDLWTFFQNLYYAEASQKFHRLNLYKCLPIKQ